VFPRDLSKEPDLDEVYMRHRRLVLIGVAVAGLVMFELIPSLTAAERAERIAFWLDLTQSWQPLLFFVCIAAIALTTNKLANVSLLFVLMIVNVASFLRWGPL
jgi:CBS domain containing-hemolysin-like protein